MDSLLAGNDPHEVPPCLFVVQTFTVAFPMAFSFTTVRKVRSGGGVVVVVVVVAALAEVEHFFPPRRDKYSSLLGEEEEEEDASKRSARP